MSIFPPTASASCPRLPGAHWLTTLMMLAEAINNDVTEQ